MMYQFEWAKALYLRSFWLPWGLWLLIKITLTLCFGPGPWWGEGLVAILGLFVILVSGVMLLLGASLICAGWWVRRGVILLIAATLVAGLPALYFAGAMLVMD